MRRRRGKCHQKPKPGSLLKLPVLWSLSDSATCTVQHRNRACARFVNASITVTVHSRTYLHDQAVILWSCRKLSKNKTSTQTVSVPVEPQTQLPLKIQDSERTEYVAPVSLCVVCAMSRVCSPSPLPVFDMQIQSVKVWGDLLVCWYCVIPSNVDRKWTYGGCVWWRLSWCFRVRLVQGLRLERSQSSINGAHCSVHSKLTNKKIELYRLGITPVYPLLSIWHYETLHDLTARDEIAQAFTLHICMLAMLDTVMKRLAFNHGMRRYLFSTLCAPLP